MNSITPSRDDKFSFGLWTIGRAGAHPFGSPTRAELNLVTAFEHLSELGRRA